MEATLQWSKLELLSEVYNDFDFSGLYLHLLCLNGFNRIIYIGEGNVANRQTDYKKEYYKNKFSKYSCMDVSKIPEIHTLFIQTFLIKQIVPRN